MSDSDDLLIKLQSALSNNDEKGFCELFQTYDIEPMGECLLRDATLFVRICAQGISSVVYFFLENCEGCVDLKAEYEGRTALQWACLRGHVDIVERLLAMYQEKGMTLKAEASHECSEFYSASLGGHMDIMRLLMDRFPDKVMDEDVCQVLLYAACVGGHLPMVKMWLRPGINVNEPLSLVTSLLDCEHRTPFQAACEGHHVELAVLLMDEFKAEITQHLANRFPHITEHLVDSVYRPLHDTDDQVKYVLTSVNIHVIQPSWILPHLSVITHLDLSNNKLRQLPDCIPWSMRSLLDLDISHNRLRELSVPENLEEIACDNLEKVIASHNNLAKECVELFQRPSLVYLDLSHNKLQRLTKSQPVQNPSDIRRPKWNCESLTTLNLSHNCLDLLPADDIKTCTALTALDVSHNRLWSLPPPWDCKLERLNVSHNQLDRFPPSTEQYWSGSLTHLQLSHNYLDQLNESVLKFGTLQTLNASHNKIQFLAPAHVWDCPSLQDLNLGHNCLGQAQQNSPRGAPRVIEFPSDQLSEELRLLDLSNNGLTHVPTTVCYIKNLAMLDLSDNPIRELPKELGNLSVCWDLKLKRLNLQKADQQEIARVSGGIAPRPPAGALPLHPTGDLLQPPDTRLLTGISVPTDGSPKEVIEHMRKQLRKVKACHVLKVLVIGPQNKGKSTVIESLVRANVKEVKLSQQYVTVTSATLKSPGGVKINERADNDRPSISLRIWELAGNPELMALQPLLWSENSLFLLVWDMTEEVSGMSHWLSSIRSRLDRVSIILVATFRDRIPAAEVSSRVNQFHTDVNNMYGDAVENAGVYPKEDDQKMYPHLCSVVFVTREMLRQDVSELRKAVYRSALSLVKIVRPQEFVVGQLLPQSYLVIEEKMKKMAAQFSKEGRPPYLSQQEFDDLLQSDPAADFDMFDDQLEALKVWCQMGSVLHYDVWADGLGRLYFLDPNWLASMAALVLMPKVAVPYKQSLRDIQERLALAGYPENLFKPFLQLLKYFDIGTLLSDHESLLLPCLLPKSAPGLELSSTTNGCKLLRFYAMPHVPVRLWSRLILSFLMSMDRFSQSCWQGQEVKKPQLTYWQEGLTIKYKGGSIVIESATFMASQEMSRHSGILISILTDSPTLGDLAVIGFVTDQIDSALQTIFPHYNDNSSLFGIYALCPVCYHDVEPCTGIIHGKSLHFALADCAADLLYSNFTQCSRGNKVSLEDLIPEFMMGELPKGFLLQSDKVHLQEKLGGGAAGTVYRGMLFENPVAVKEFYRNRVRLPTDNEEGVTSDSGTSTMSSTSSQSSSVGSSLFSGVYGNYENVSNELQLRRQDYMMGVNLKICRAFSELRQEIVILSQLRHPCLISLLGVSIRPSLLVVLELAPFGSLRSVLNDHMKDRPFNKYRDRDRTFSSVLDKDITFKIVYQVAVGLEYLHLRRILYRDLKSDNILVCSLTPTDGVNVKISDYGISKFTTSQGMMGMVGTPGYMAPEIMDGQAYNEKVDIFSFSMVVYELLTGHPPFEKYDRLHQLHQKINFERSRPSLMEYNVVSNFPCLESLMEKMWAHDPHERPSAKDIVQQMEDVGFLLQHSHLAPSSDWQEKGRSGSVCSSMEGGLFCNITCAWALNETSRSSLALGRNICWVWESPSAQITDRHLYVYNLASGKLQMPSRKDSPGCPVTCMAQIGQHRWVGCKGGGQESGQEPRIDVFPIRCVDSAKAKCRLGTLEADPVAIIQDKNNPNKDMLSAGSEGLVYVALSNGTIQIYQHQTKRPRTTLNLPTRNMPLTEWQRHKTLTVTSTSTIHAICLVPSQRELVVGCGHSLAIISTDTLLVERRVCPVKDLPTSVKDKVDCIQAMVRNEHTLWCSFKNSPLIVEFDIGSWRVARAYVIEADLQVYIMPVRLRSKPAAEHECQTCHGKSSSAKTGGSGGERSHDGDWKNTASPSPPPRPDSSTKPGYCSAHSGHHAQGTVTEEEAFDPSEVQMRPKRLSRGRNTDRDEAPSGLHDHIDPETEAPSSFLRTENNTSFNRKVSLYGEEVFHGVDEDPPSLPPRRPATDYQAKSATVAAATLTKDKSLTLPDLSMRRRLPPPAPQSPTSPQRRSLPSEHDGIHVQSLLCVRDTLWIGTSCGEILVIGVKETSPLKSGEDGDQDQSDPPDSPTHPRLSLNLEGKQICNLASVRMNTDRGLAGTEPRNKSGGVHILVQARDLVVAVRNISQAEETKDIAEIAVWEACSAERIVAIRRYWQLLAALVGNPT